MTASKKKEASRVYNLEQQQRYNERQIRKYKRLYNGSIDPENVAKHKEKLRYWQGVQNDFVKTNGEVLKRRYENEKLLVTEFADLPTEAEKISKNQSFVVENKTIESREYIEKFAKITDNPDERHEYYKASKEILNHRSGQNGEDLYL